MLSAVLPSSQASNRVSTTPLPHESLRWHSAEQPLPLSTLLPSSHVSPGPTTPSLQVALLQLLWQASVSTRLPSSHCSTPGAAWSRTPSPHIASAQLLRQLSVSMLLPSSHCSTPALTTPSPHTAVLHALV